MDLKFKRKTKLALLCGLLGCFCFGAGDWLDRLSTGIHQQPDERKYAPLVWQYAAMELNP